MTSWTLTTSGAAIYKAGLNASNAATMSGAKMDKWSDEAEGFLCAATRKDWVTDYSTVKTNFKPILSNIISDMVAMRIINYDMSGYTSRSEAQTMLDVLKDDFSLSLSVLKEIQNQEKM